MAWRRPGVKPLSDTMLVSLLMHICITQPQWMKSIHYCNVHFRKHVWNSVSVVLSHGSQWPCSISYPIMSSHISICLDPRLHLTVQTGTHFRIMLVLVLPICPNWLPPMSGNLAQSVAKPGQSNAEWMWWLLGCRLGESLSCDLIHWPLGDQAGISDL